jgi:hypothetical protein
MIYMNQCSLSGSILFILIRWLPFDVYSGKGAITKAMQMIIYHILTWWILSKRKETFLHNWTFQSSSTTGPALQDNLETTQSKTFGASNIKLGDHLNLLNQAREHVNWLHKQLDKWFTPSPLQEHLDSLFHPRYLMEHEKRARSADYGRSSSIFLRKKYRNLPNFDPNNVMHKWDSLKLSVFNLITHLSNDYPVKESGEISSYWERQKRICSSKITRIFLCLCLSIRAFPPIRPNMKEE